MNAAEKWKQDAHYERLMAGISPLPLINAWGLGTFECLHCGRFPVYPIYAFHDCWEIGGSG